MLKKVLLGLGLVVLVGAAVAVWLDVPRFVIGVLTYGRQVREGTLQVGDPAPSVVVYDLDGRTAQPLGARIDGRPLVLIFGSFT